METTLYSKFLDDEEIACRIYEMVTNDILGKEQLEKIKLRYHDMHRNFFKYSKDEAKKLGKDAVWEFSTGVEPFKPVGWERYYEDTILVPIPISHPNFIDLTMRKEKRGAIGLDLPTWFNLKDNDKRIMLVAQDPLRNNKWYSDVEISKEDKKNKTWKQRRLYLLRRIGIFSVWATWQKLERQKEWRWQNGIAC